MAAFRYRCLPPYTKLDEGHAERSTLHKIQFGPRFFHLNWLFALHTGAKHQDRVSKHLPWSQKYVALSEFCATIKGQRSPNRIMCTRGRIMTTRIAGGLLLGYNPRVPGQGLKPLA